MGEKYGILERIIGKNHNRLRLINEHKLIAVFFSEAT